MANIDTTPGSILTLSPQEIELINQQLSDIDAQTHNIAVSTSEHFNAVSLALVQIKTQVESLQAKLNPS